MKTDRSTKVILMLIAIGLFLNAADKFSVDPVIAEEEINDSSELGRYIVANPENNTRFYRIDTKTGAAWKIDRSTKNKWQKIEEPYGR